MAAGKGRIALFVLLGLGAFAATAGFLVVDGLRRVSDEIRTAPGFAAAWPQVAAHPKLVEVMGPPQLAPFDLVAFLQGRQAWTFTSRTTEAIPQDRVPGVRRRESNEIEVPIAGTRGKGTLRIAARQVGEAWQIDRLEARVDGRSGALNLLATAAPTSTTPSTSGNPSATP
ncbi:MAG TPA: hypothetical protein VGF45_22845 [Polyangia bacterium]